MEYYDRYKAFRKNGEIELVPFIEIERSNSDIVIAFEKYKMRLDNISYKYYGDSNFAWLIMLANPQWGSMEFEIPDGIKLRIPYPLNSALSRYEQKIKEYQNN